MKKTMPRVHFVALVCTLGIACGADERQCYPGDFIACVCEDRRAGYAQCDVGGSAYGACAFCGTTPGLAQSGGGEGGEGGEGGAALLPFMAECEADEECETGLCFFFPAKGSYCSHSCETAGDCELPSPGCNGMGVCKAP